MKNRSWIVRRRHGPPAAFVYGTEHRPAVAAQRPRRPLIPPMGEAGRRHRRRSRRPVLRRAGCRDIRRHASARARWPRAAPRRVARMPVRTPGAAHGRHPTRGSRRAAAPARAIAASTRARGRQREARGPSAVAASPGRRRGVSVTSARSRRPARRIRAAPGAGDASTHTSGMRRRAGDQPARGRHRLRGTAERLLPRGQDDRRTTAACRDVVRWPASAGQPAAAARRGSVSRSGALADEEKAVAGSLAAAAWRRPPAVHALAALQTPSTPQPAGRTRLSASNRRGPQPRREPRGVHGWARSSAWRRDRQAADAGRARSVADDRLAPSQQRSRRGSGSAKRTCHTRGTPSRRGQPE